MSLKQNKTNKKNKKNSINSIIKFYHKPVKTGDENETISIEECFKNIRPCFSDMINNPRASGTCKIHLTMKIIFVSSKDNDEKRVSI